MASGRLIDYLGYGTLAARPASPDLFTGTLGVWFSTDTGRFTFWTGAAWVDGLNPAPVVVEATTSRAADPDEPGEWVRFTHDDPKVFTFDGIADYRVDDEYFAENVGIGDLTLDVDNGFTLIPPLGGSLIVPQGGVVAIKIVAVDEAKVVGNTEADGGS